MSRAIAAGPASDADPGPRLTYVTAEIADQLFGVAIGQVRDVFSLDRVTPVPLAPPEVAGLLNLRGRVVTALDLKPRLDVTQGGGASRARMALGIEAGSESFGLLVDRVGEVCRIAAATLEANPIHLSASWAALSRGVHQFQERLLVVLDIDAVLASIRRSVATRPAHSWSSP